MIRPWPLLVLCLILVACAGPSVQRTTRARNFNYSYPYRAISSEEFVPQIDLAGDAAQEVLTAAQVLSGEENPTGEMRLAVSPMGGENAISETSAPPAAQISPGVTKATPGPEDSLAQLIDQMATQDTPAAQYLADDLFIKATDASLQGNTGLAIKLYRYLVRLRPQEVELQRKLAMELVRGGEVPEALQIVQTLHQQAPFADESITLALAGLYTVSGQNAAAFALYQQAMKHFPRSESTCGMAIEAYEQAQKLNEAAQVALDCQKRMPTAVFAYYRGRIALAQDKTALGIKYLEQALKIDPRYRPAALVLGLLAEQEGNYARAKKIYLEFLRHDESNLVILGRLVQIYFNEQDYKSALPWAERMANLDAEDLSLKLKLAILYLDLRQIDDARSILQEILAAIPDSDKAWYYLGAAEVLAAHEAAAFSAWAKIGEESSLFAQARLQQAQILWAKLKQAATPENEAAFLDFLALNENHPKIEADFKLMHAAYAQEKGDSALALAILRQLEREQKLDMDGQYYFMVLLQENKATEEALEIGRKLLAKHPDHAHALNFVGYALLEDQNKFDEAYTYLQRAINLAPDDYYIRDSLAWYYYRTANYGQAAREIKTALAAAPEDAALNHHAALIAVSLQQKEQACRYFQKAWQAGKEELRSEIAGQVEICSNFSFADHPAERPDPAATAAAAVSFPVVTNDALASPEEESRDQGDRERSVEVNVARPSVSTTDAEISADGPPAAASVVVPPPPSAPASSTTTTEGPNPAREQGAKAFPDSLLPDDPILLDPQDN